MFNTKVNTTGFAILVFAVILSVPSTWASAQNTSQTPHVETYSATESQDINKHVATADAGAKTEPQWEELSNEDGIKTWRKEVPGSDVVAFRGHAVVAAPLAKVASVLIDTSRKLEWVANIAKAKDIRQINDHERIEYNHTYSGFFLVRDRDFVFNAKVLLDRPTSTMTVLLKSTEDPDMPEGSPVRGEIKNGSYILRALENDTKTDVTVEIHADPKGAIPKWIVNLFQKNWPRKTLAGIQKQALKADVSEHAAIRNYFHGAPAETVSGVQKK